MFPNAFFELQERCILDGTLTVNYEQVDVDYRLKHNDLLANIVHRYAVRSPTPLSLHCVFKWFLSGNFRPSGYAIIEIMFQLL